MAKKIAFCGLDCAECPALLAYLTNDQALREKAAREWSAQFGADIPPGQINCVGCTETEGVHIGHCAECKIRVCGLGKGVANCALCADYPCELIAGFIAKVPPARANLEEIRAAKAH